jgi:hypothetical protein
METLFPHLSDRRAKDVRIQIEPAHNCDGSCCRIPIFRGDGTLNYVAPHSHLVEWGAEGPSYHPVLCDFPEDVEPSDADSLFTNYPPFVEEQASAWRPEGEADTVTKGALSATALLRPESVDHRTGPFLQRLVMAAKVLFRSSIVR